MFSFFRKNSSVPQVDFSTVVTDMHSHLIPGIDDGAKTLEDSVTLIKELHALGYKKFITTPHIMSDFYRNTPEIILEGLEQVRQAIKAENIPVTISAAAEYYLDDGFIHKLEEEKLLTLGDNNHLLFEISYVNAPDNLMEVIFRMQVLGYKPIMAHPERYPFWGNNFDFYGSLRDQGVLLQLNVNSLSGYYGPDAKRIAEKLIEKEWVDLIGTDTHAMKHIQALQRTVKEKSFRKVLEFNLLNKHL
ncbi:MAG: capsular biosynthesis protein [Bacteroidetes bacterium]|jgi:tyrosine-protein phosphatase YwqE|nr:capsular biosynthesis protein [Bacteroidota bacterium]